MVNHGMLAGIVAVYEHATGTQSVLLPQAPHWVPISVVSFISLYIEIYLMHWTHGIEDTNTLDVGEYYHLFDSPIVRTQLQ